MIRNGVDKALLMPLAEGVDSHNTYQIECMRRFPGRFSVIATVDPHRPEAPERLEEWAEQGAEGVRLNPADPLAIWQKAGEVEDICTYAHRLKAAVRRYEGGSVKHDEEPDQSLITVS